MFESPLIDGEALITVSDLAVESAGFHMEHHLKENYYDIITEENVFRQQYYQQAYMGFMRNPGKFSLCVNKAPLLICAGKLDLG